MLSSQLMHLVTCLPVLSLCHDSVETYKRLVACIMSNAYLVDTYVESLPFAMQMVAQQV